MFYIESQKFKYTGHFVYQCFDRRGIQYHQKWFILIVILIGGILFNFGKLFVY